MNPLAARFPTRRLTLALVRRGLLLWILARAMLMLMSVVTASSDTATAHHLSPLAALMLVILVGALGVLESRRVNEHRFFANLGVSPITAALLVMLPALIGEVVIGILLWR